MNGAERGLVGTVVEVTDWSGYRCGCGRDASHLPDLLLRLLKSHGEQDDTVGDEITSHVVTSEYLNESALPAARALLAGLADGVEWDVYAKVTQILVYILSCATVVNDFPPVDPGYVGLCRAEVRKAEWMFWRDLRAGAPDAVATNITDVFELLDEEEDTGTRRNPHGGDSTGGQGRAAPPRGELGEVHRDLGECRAR